MNTGSVSFDRVAEHYDATRGRSATGTAHETELLAAALPASGRVLEIGVGTGQVAIRYMRQACRWSGSICRRR